MSDPQRVAVVGATGYAGFELAQASASASGNCQADILFARERQAGELPDGDFSAAARLGRSALPAVFGGGDRRERRQRGVSGDAARGFAGTGPAAAGGGAARGGFERRVPLSRSGDVRAAGTSCRRRDAALLAEAVYGLPELYGKALAERATGGQSRLLSDVRDSGAAAAGRGGMDRAGARHRLRLQVRRDGSRQGTQARTALRRSGREFPRLRAVHAPAHAGSDRASGARRRAR